MSAVLDIERKQDVASFLSAPFDTWSADAILAYFHTRRSVRYFAIADENEVVRHKIDAILDNRFDFNAETYHFDNKIDWLNNPSPDIEWAIMLHKFYYAVGLGMAYQETTDERYAIKWMALTQDWIDSVPVGHLSSDVTGRRIQNWIFAHYYFVTVCRSPSVTPGFYQAFLQSIHDQVSFLCLNLTPARNHRTLELYTIFLAAVVFPELQAAPDWLAFASRELLTNIQTDILPDGVHCELSTDYHHIVMRNFLAVKRLALENNIALPEAFDLSLKQALDFSVHAHKPDGSIPSLSDGDTGSFLNLLTQAYQFYGEEHYRYVATSGQEGIPPGQRCKAFPEGGYYLQRSGWGESGESYQDERYLIFDCGPVGAGNHGHLDLLSFEMAAYGRSLIVDPGRYTYDESGKTNWRVLFRGTGYHNTVQVDGLNQTRYEFHKRKFKITGDHPDFHLKAFATTPGLDYLHGVARSKEYPVVHERKILFVEGEYWVICDQLTASEPHRYDLLFHLSELAKNKVSVANNPQCMTITSPHLLVAQVQDGGSELSIEDGFISKTYGVKLAAPILRFSREAATTCFYTVLYPFKTIQPDLAVRKLSLYPAQADASRLGIDALEITIELDGRRVRDRLSIWQGSDGQQGGGWAFYPAVQVERCYPGLQPSTFQINLPG